MHTMRKGFTLIEMIVAIGILGAITTITGQGLITMMQAKKVIDMNQAVLEDGQTVLNTISSDVQNNAIDYRGYWEFYSRTVLGGGYNLIPGNDYSHIWTNGSTSEIALGCVIATTPCYYQQFLVLTSPDAQERIVYGAELSNKAPCTTDCERILSKLDLRACDTKPADGVPDLYLPYSPTKDLCSTDDHGKAISTGDLDDTNPEEPYDDYFYPVTSLRTNITDLRFYVTPANDPYKAYAIPEYQVQPAVTIVMKIKPSKLYYGSAADKMNEITLQTTVTHRFMSEVKNTAK